MPITLRRQDGKRESDTALAACQRKASQDRLRGRTPCLGPDKGKPFCRACTESALLQQLRRTSG